MMKQPTINQLFRNEIGELKGENARLRADLERVGEERDQLRVQVEHLTELVRDAYDYTPECTRIAEDIAALFPDIARPRDV